jgi:hypothetical protein
MAKICYIPRRFTTDVMAIIDKANGIIADYSEQDIMLTLRQLYYRFIALDLFPKSWIDPVYNAKHRLPPDTKNTQKNYKRLGSIINDARLAGEVDWSALEDITRNVAVPSAWSDVAHILRDVAAGYAIDKWQGQEYRPEVWVEKDAAINVVVPVCTRLNIAYFSCRGFTSQSEMHSAGKRLERIENNGQHPVIIHIGDHDPSGIDMTRDIDERLVTFMGGLDVKRIALNMDQVRKYKCPPNPAKSTDSRYDNYKKKFGNDSWELDALEPRVLVDLIQKTVLELRDEKLYKQREQQEAADREHLDVLVIDERDRLEKIRKAAEREAKRKAALAAKKNKSKRRRK